MSNDFGRSVPLTDRTVERTQGCWNCTGYEHGAIAVKRLEECRQRDLAAKIAEHGFLPSLSRLGDMEHASSLAKDARYDNWVLAAKSGQIGLCLRGGVEDDFVHHKYLCPKWNAAQGASVARAGAKADLLPDELAEVVEARAKKV